MLEHTIGSCQIDNWQQCFAAHMLDIPGLYLRRKMKKIISQSLNGCMYVITNWNIVLN